MSAQECESNNLASLTPSECKKVQMNSIVALKV